jgi:hypothetical protein
VILVGKKFGQLSNQLFLFGHLIAYASHFGDTIVNPAFAEYAPFFQGTRDDVLARFPSVTGKMPPASRFRRPVQAISYACHLLAKRLLEEPGTLADRSRSSTGITIVKRWPLTFPELFHAQEGVIRDFLSPAPWIKEQVDDRTASVRDDGELLIGVHIRRGDYKLWRGGAYYYDISAYVDLLGRMDRHLSGAHYLLCSNENLTPWISDFERAGLDVHYPAGSPVTDSYALSTCDLILGPPSTFSAWASFFGEVPLCWITDPASSPTLDDFVVFREDVEFPGAVNATD